jgi:TRAP-type mannitol/chloroaromatic compound transport system substrate-binding protein
MVGPAAKFFSEVLGASCTQMSGGEIYTGLKLGTIDATEFSGGSLDYALGIHEVTKYCIMPYYSSVGQSEFLVNLKAYESLPKDIKTILDLCFLWAEIHISQWTLNDNEKAKAAMEAKGMEVVWLNKEDQTKIRKLASEWWMKQFGEVSPEAKKLLEIHNAKMKDVGLLK